MSRTVSSEGGSYDDSVGPFTPEFVPQLDAVQVEDDNNLHLGNFLKPDEDIGISLRKPFCPLVTSSTPSLAPARRICFVGAGYVGKLAFQGTTPRANSIPRPSLTQPFRWTHCSGHCP